MIKKNNIKKIIIDVEGSSYVRFETDLKLKNEVLGDFYWQGDGKFFEIELGSMYRQGDFDEGEQLTDFMDEETIEWLEELADEDLRAFI